MGKEKEEFSEAEFSEKGDEFSELIRYTLPGYFLGLLAGVFLDSQGYQRSFLGQWLVRTLAGEGVVKPVSFISIKSHLFLWII